ncbi:MAG: FAD-binding oxidoreductase [Acidimicrobiia bacterium]
MTRFDVAVVGGGIAGTSVAYFLAEHCSVVVLEREATLGVHSTGRSAAIFTECYGDRVVRQLAIASRGFLEQTAPGFSDQPLLSDRSILFIATHAQADRMELHLEDYRSMVPDVRRLRPKEAVALCPALDGRRLAGAIHELEARDLDVHALHMGYQRGIRERGGEIRPGFGVDRVTRAGEEWVIGSGEAEITAAVLIDAAGAWCDVVAALAGASPVGLVPKRRTAFSFDSPGWEVHRWPMVIDLDEQFYFKPEGPGLLGSPADEMPMEPHDVRHREEDVALGIERIEAATTLSIRSVRNAWAGLRSFVVDHRPVNGWDDSVPGFYWLAGQGGFGIKTSPAMGRYAAAMVLRRTPPAGFAEAGLNPEALGVSRLRGLAGV